MEALMTNEPRPVRLDKWLKIARIFKKRSDAAGAVDGGSVKVNGERAKPAKIIHEGDVLTVRTGSRYRTITVRVVTDRPVKASKALEYYDEKKSPGVTPEMEEMIKILEKQDRKNRAGSKGKPDKRERRKINRFKYGE
jgi:ribosome-associated heat shock protein Hsp15